LFKKEQRKEIDWDCPLVKELAVEPGFAKPPRGKVVKLGFKEYKRKPAIKKT
jgi:hypothetical protein